MYIYNYIFRWQTYSSYRVCYRCNDDAVILKSGMKYDLSAEAIAKTGLTQEEQNKLRTYLNRDRVLTAFDEGE